MKNNQLAETLAWSVYYQLKYEQQLSKLQLDSAAGVLASVVELLPDDYFDVDAKPDTQACIDGLKKLSAGNEQSLEEMAAAKVSAKKFKPLLKKLYWL